MSRKNLSTRTRILDTTWKLLEGGSQVRMSDIAKAVGISRQALYLHFPSRAELLVATTRHLDEVFDSDTRLAASRTAPSGRARLRAFVEAWGNFIPEVQGVVRALMAMEQTDAEARDAWADRKAAIRQGWAAAVEALARDGALRLDLDVEQATDLLNALVTVETWVALREGAGWSQAEYLAQMHRLAVAAVCGPGEDGCPDG